MFVRAHAPQPFRWWVKRTVAQLLLFAVIPSLLGAAIIARETTPSSGLDVSPTPRVVMHETR